MKEGQIASWRMWAFENLDSVNKFTKKELLSFMDIAPTDLSPFQMQEAILEQLREDIILGGISHEDVVFVICDSSVMCKHKIEDMINAAKKRMHDAVFVLIDTHVGRAENMYKLTREGSYKQVNFDKLRSNLNILSGDEQCKKVYMKKPKTQVAVIHTNFFTDNFILTVLEDEYLKNNKWKQGSRNEVNDDAQLQILSRIVEHMPGSSGLIISNDKGIVRKVSNYSSERNIFYMEMS